MHGLPQRTLGHVEATGGLLHRQEPPISRRVGEAVLDGPTKTLDGMEDRLRCGSCSAVGDTVEASMLVERPEERDAALDCVEIEQHYLIWIGGENGNALLPIGAPEHVRRASRCRRKRRRPPHGALTTPERLELAGQLVDFVESRGDWMGQHHAPQTSRRFVTSSATIRRRRGIRATGTPRSRASVAS